MVHSSLLNGLARVAVCLRIKLGPTVVRTEMLIDTRQRVKDAYTVRWLVRTRLKVVVCFYYHSKCSLALL